MILRFLTLMVLSGGVSLANPTQQARPSQPSRSASTQYPESKLTIRVIPAQDQTWGFAIDRDQQPFIRQLSIPALPGNRGFTSQAKARKAAQLMVNKIRQGQMPPSLTVQELQAAKLL